MRILALGGVAGPAVFTTLVVVCGALRPGYSHARQFISELGATGTANAALMNGAGFLPAGLLVVAFAASLAVAFPRGPATLVAAACMTLFGLGHVGAGIYSCDPGCPLQNASWEASVHDGISQVAFVAGIAGTALWSWVFRRRAGWRRMGVYSAVTSAVALVLLIGMVVSFEERAFTGVWQRAFLATLYLWCVAVGLRVYRAGGATA